MTDQKATWETGRNTDSFSKAAPLPYSMITVKITELEKITRSDMQSLITFW